MEQVVEGTVVPRGRLKAPPPRNRATGYIGCLVGGYKETRAEVGRELLQRYGIWCKHNMGPERRPGVLEIYKEVEIVLILEKDAEHVRDKVLRACEKQRLPLIEISRKKRNDWDALFKTRGYDNPPSWRDGFDVDKVLGPDSLDHIEPPRLAFEDPQLKAGRLAKLAEAQRPPTPEPESPKPAPVVAKPPEEKSNRVLSAFDKNAFENFSKAVIEARRRSGKDRSSFAADLGMTPGGVANWEHCKGGMPYYESYAKVNAKWPDLFPPITGLRGELKARAAGHRLLTGKPGTIVVPPPATPYVPAGKAKPAPAPVVAPAKNVGDFQDVTTPSTPTTPSHVRTQIVDDDRTLTEYMAALGELRATNQVITDAQAKREEILARVDALHRLVTGR
jgi:hypothetical protein